MNLAQRIQHLRKQQGISQEELADALGVSRQAVSKWESGQSIPDVDRVIQLSDYFHVTTDHLLKGTEQGTAQPRQPGAMFFAKAATALNGVGLLVAAMLWHDWQSAAATLIGLCVMALGCMTYALGMTMATDEGKPQARQWYWRVNVWIISFAPLAMLCNGGGIAGAPYPLLEASLWHTAVFLLLYAALGITVCRITRVK